VTHDELVAHVAELTGALRVPLNVDSERCFADDLDGVAQTVWMLHDAGADCVYAPGLMTSEQVRVVVEAVGVPVNVLARPTGPAVAQLGAAGARRVSVGGALASAAYGALMIGARELLTAGTSGYLATALRADDRAALRR
jgi:2-methylisocitrate lyase-like PEP mutase family enzyme